MYIYKEKFIMLLLLALFLSGCSSKEKKIPPVISVVAAEPANTGEQLQNTIVKFRESSNKINKKAKLFHRNLSLNYKKGKNYLEDRQKRMLISFFDSIPKNKKISVILSASPSTSSGFYALNDAWVRSQELKALIQGYSDQVDILYIPDQKPNSITIQVLGGEDVY